MTIPDPAPVALALGLGLLAGGLYFAALWISVRRLTGDGGWRGFALAMALRLLAILGALGALAWAGAGAAELLAAGIGFVIARVAATRIARRPAGDG